MLTQRYRPVFQAAIALVVIWLLAVAGYRFALSFSKTVGEVNAYAASVDLAHLAGAERSSALRKLESMINSLSEEQLAQLSSKAISRWRDAMTDGERARFRSATADSGFKLPNEIDELPPDQKEKALEARLEALRKARARSLSAGETQSTTNVAVPKAGPE
jgi:hypothetical protein